MKTATKPIKLFSLIKELDKWVSLFVRLNAADDRGTISCCCCGDRVYFGEAECAHFKDRNNMATRYYLPNLGAAARGCNSFDHYNHIARWEAKMTPEQLADLEIKSHSFQKFTRPELDGLILEYKTKVEQLRKSKNL